VAPGKELATRTLASELAEYRIETEDGLSYDFRQETSRKKTF
jgi:hypothetical protein